MTHIPNHRQSCNNGILTKGLGLPGYHSMITSSLGLGFCRVGINIFKDNAGGSARGSIEPYASRRREPEPETYTVSITLDLKGKSFNKKFQVTEKTAKAYVKNITSISGAFKVSIQALKSYPKSFGISIKNISSKAKAKITNIRNK